MIIHDVVKNERIKAGRSQQEVADYLGIERSTYTYYEAGRIRIPTEILNQIADYLNLPHGFYIERGTKVLTFAEFDECLYSGGGPCFDAPDATAGDVNERDNETDHPARTVPCYALDVSGGEAYPCDEYEEVHKDEFKGDKTEAPDTCRIEISVGDDFEETDGYEYDDVYEEIDGSEDREAFDAEDGFDFEETRGSVFVFDDDYEEDSEEDVPRYRIGGVQKAAGADGENEDGAVIRVGEDLDGNPSDMRLYVVRAIDRREISAIAPSFKEEEFVVIQLPSADAAADDEAYDVPDEDDCCFDAGLAAVSVMDEQPPEFNAVSYPGAIEERRTAFGSDEEEYDPEETDYEVPEYGRVKAGYGYEEPKSYYIEAEPYFEEAEFADEEAKPGSAVYAGPSGAQMKYMEYRERCMLAAVGFAIVDDGRRPDPEEEFRRPNWSICYDFPDESEYVDCETGEFDYTRIHRLFEQALASCRSVTDQEDLSE